MYYFMHMIYWQFVLGHIFKYLILITYNEVLNLSKKRVGKKKWKWLLHTYQSLACETAVSTECP